MSKCDHHFHMHTGLLLTQSPPLLSCQFRRLSVIFVYNIIFIHMFLLDANHDPILTNSFCRQPPKGQQMKCRDIADKLSKLIIATVTTATTTKTTTTAATMMTITMTVTAAGTNNESNNTHPSSLASVAASLYDIALLAD